MQTSVLMVSQYMHVELRVAVNAYLHPHPLNVINSGYTVCVITFNPGTMNGTSVTPAVDIQTLVVKFVTCLCMYKLVSIMHKSKSCM